MSGYPAASPITLSTPQYGHNAVVLSSPQFSISAKGKILLQKKQAHLLLWVRIFLFWKHALWAFLRTCIGIFMENLPDGLLLNLIFPHPVLTDKSFSDRMPSLSLFPHIVSTFLKNTMRIVILSIFTPVRWILLISRNNNLLRFQYSKKKEKVYWYKVQKRCFLRKICFRFDSHSYLEKIRYHLMIYQSSFGCHCCCCVLQYFLFAGVKKFWNAGFVFFWKRYFHRMDRIWSIMDGISIVLRT